MRPDMTQPNEKQTERVCIRALVLPGHVCRGDLGHGRRSPMCRAATAPTDCATAGTPRCRARCRPAPLPSCAAVASDRGARRWQGRASAAAPRHCADATALTDRATAGAPLCRAATSTPPMDMPDTKQPRRKKIRQADDSRGGKGRGAGGRIRTEGRRRRWRRGPVERSDGDARRINYDDEPEVRSRARIQMDKARRAIRGAGGHRQDAWMTRHD